MEETENNYPEAENTNGSIITQSINPDITFNYQDYSQWWAGLTEDWKNIFRKSTGFTGEPTKTDLEKISLIERLNCASSDITDLEPLAQLTGLKEINCYSTAITSLEPLRNHNKLQALLCWRTNISSLEPLYQLKKLKTLIFNYTGVSAEEIENFKKAKPKCVISE